MSKDALDQIIEYHAEDSCLFDVSKRKAYLWGKAIVKYEGMEVKAAIIVLDFQTKQLYAKGRLNDSSGAYVDRPFFNDGERQTEADTMIYNFETKRGRTYGIAMKEGEGYILCNKVLRDDDKSIYSDLGKYTTCNDKTHPHFYLQSRNLKIVPDKKIIFGPSNLVIEGIPTPLYLPFGMFPTKKGQSSGLIPFEYGSSGLYGPYLRNMGYHFAISDYIDQSITGDAYFRGSWRLASNTRYVKRYNYNGNLNLEFAKYLNGEKEDLNYKQNLAPYSGS
jgi:lipopolysaccharide assembly outer membrane protein LptD (OstA)